MKDYSGKKILILGATSETGKMVQQAVSMGVETFVADPFEDSPGKKFADHPITIDCFEVDGLVRIVEENKIDGILPGCADILIPTYLEVCKRTKKYCYVNDKVVQALNNKHWFKVALQKHGLPVIGEYSKEQVEAEGFNCFPLFLKPTDNNSSKGMSIVYCFSEFEEAYRKALSFSRSKTVLIEDYKTCDDFYVGYFVQNGKVGVAFTGDRFVISQPGVGSITSAIVYPSKYSDLYYKTTHKKMLELFTEIGFRNGICAIQGFVEDGKIMFYDPALRITGGQEYMLIKHFTGVDELASLVSFALTGKMGEEGQVEKCDSTYGGRIGCNLTFSCKCCTLGSIKGIEYARNHIGVLNITQEHKSGDVIDKLGTAQQNFARMHLFAESPEAMKNLIIDLQEHVIAYNDKGEESMVRGFNPEKWYSEKDVR